MHLNVEQPDRSGPTRAGLSEILRDRTAEAHSAAEEAMDFDYGHPDAAHYLGVLNGLMAFHTSVARFSWPTVANEFDQDMAALVRIQSLRTDISVMSVRSPTSARGANRTCGRPPRRPVVKNQLRGGREARIGAAYVAAGSVLGGRAIAASLAAGNCSEFPRAFFASEGLDLARLWRQFKVALDAFGDSGADAPQVVAGALAAFETIREVLSAPETDRGPTR